VVSLAQEFVVSSLEELLEVILELVHPHSQELDALLPENSRYIDTSAKMVILTVRNLIHCLLKYLMY
jgi:hypothetical protein